MASGPTNLSNDGSTDEINYYAGYKLKTNDLLTIDFGATVFHYPDTLGDNETLESFVGLAFDTIASPAVYAYYDYDLEAFTYEASALWVHSLSETAKLAFGIRSGGNGEHLGPAGRDNNLWGSFSFTAGF
mgnify:CR=1 FL=1